MAVKLITFIGTNNYLECRYQLGDRVSRGGRFIQAALAEILLDNQDEEREIHVFMTEKAREKNWFDSKNKEGKHLDGLQTEIARLKETPDYHNLVLKNLMIPEGFSTEDIWIIFECLQNTLEDGDEIILDITHSFRSIPLLSLLLINYVRLFKKVTVRGIYYGAFEELGTVRDAENIPFPDRIANIVDLSEFFQLFNWSNAVDKFLSTGNASSLYQLSNEELKPLKRDAKDSDPELIDFSRFIKNLNDFFEQIATCRERTLLNKTAERLYQNFSKISKDRICYIKALVPLMQVMEEKLAGIRNEDKFARSAFLVDWCLEHGLIQQGWTMLRENLVSFLYDRAGIKKYGLPLEKGREIVASAAIVANRIPQEEWKGEINKYPEIVGKIESEPILAEASVLLDQIWKYRNDLNHAEHSKQRHRAGSFRTVLQTEQNKFNKLISGEAPVSCEQNRKRVLLSPLGNSPGLLYSALKHLQPEDLMVVTSSEAAKKLNEIMIKCDYKGSLTCFYVNDAFTCFHETERVYKKLIAKLPDAGEAEIFLNITGGTTALQYIVQQVSRILEDQGYHVRTVAFIDRRTGEEQRKDPYCLGEMIEI